MNTATAATAKFLIEPGRRGSVIINESQGGQWVKVAVVLVEEAYRLSYFGFNLDAPSVQAVIERAKGATK